MSAPDLALFAPGCVVRLKGQDVAMTVVGGHRNEHVDVCWFDREDRMQATTVAIACIELCEPTDEGGSRTRLPMTMREKVGL